MRIYLLVLILSMLLFSCVRQKPISNSKKDIIKQDLNTLVDNWHLAASEANFDNYFSKMDSISVFIGTDASENWTKKAFSDFSKPYFDRGKAWSFKALERNIYMNSTGDFAWFDELLDTWMGTCRGSGVLQRKDKTWKIKHYVLSVTIPNDDIKKVIEAKREKDSVFLKNFKKTVE